MTTEHISGIISCQRGLHQTPKGKQNFFNEVNLMSGPSSFPTVEVTAAYHGRESILYFHIFHQTKHLVKHPVTSVLFNLPNPMAAHQLLGNRGRAPRELKTGWCQPYLHVLVWGLPRLTERKCFKLEKAWRFIPLLFVLSDMVCLSQKLGTRSERALSFSCGKLLLQKWTRKATGPIQDEKELTKRGEGKDWE